MKRPCPQYYSDLWSRYPREMMHVYWLKARTAGKHMLEILRTREGRTGRLLRIGLAPMDLLPNGVWMAFMYVALAAGGMWWSWRSNSALGALLAFMAVPAILLQLEATLIMSHYVINYQAYSAFFVIFISVVLPAALVGLVWDSERMRWSLRGPAGPAIQLSDRSDHRYGSRHSASHWHSSSWLVASRCLLRRCP